MSRLFRGVMTTAITLTMAAVAIVAAPSPWQAHANDYQYHLKNYWNESCVVTQGQSDRSPAFTYECANFADQKWWIETVYEGGYPLLEFINVNSGMCLTVQGTAAGNRAMQITCTGLADQLFVNQQTTDVQGYHRLWDYNSYQQVSNSGYLQVDQGAPGNGAPVFQNTDNPYMDYWAFV